jgi:hypothetical protein
VAEDEQHNSSEEAGGHFPFLHFQAALDSAREIQARLNTQGIPVAARERSLRSIPQIVLNCGPLYSSPALGYAQDHD